MTSRTDILKRAAIEIGVQRPSDFNEESEIARLARDIWPTLVKSELRKHAWSFAIDATSLGRLSDPTGGAFGAAFNLPTDMLRIVQLNDSWVDGSAEGSYQVHGRSLLTNDTTVRVRYIKDLSNDTSAWDANFVEAMVYALARAMAPSACKDKQKVRDVAASYKQAIFDAKRANAIETAPTSVQEGSWTLARFDGDNGMMRGGSYRAISTPVDAVPADGTPYDFEALVEE